MHYTVAKKWVLLFTIDVVKTNRLNIENSQPQQQTILVEANVWYILQFAGTGSLYKNLKEKEKFSMKIVFPTSRCKVMPFARLQSSVAVIQLLTATPPPVSVKGAGNGGKQRYHQDFTPAEVRLPT